MWFRTLAESVVGIEIDLGVEGPVLRASPGSVEGGVLILLSAVGKVVRIEEELRISLPGQKLEKHNNHFLNVILLHYSTRVDQHAKKSMFYETSPLPPCMAQEFYVP